MISIADAEIQQKFEANEMDGKFSNAMDRWVKVSNCNYYTQYEETMEGVVTDFFHQCEEFRKAHKKQEKQMKKELDENIELAKNIVDVKTKLLKKELSRKIEEMSEVTAERMIKIIEEIENKEKHEKQNTDELANMEGSI